MCSHYAVFFLSFFLGLSAVLADCFKALSVTEPFPGLLLPSAFQVMFSQTRPERFVGGFKR